MNKRNKSTLCKLCHFQLIYGFLGSGKTTLMSRLAQKFRSNGMKVGLITNDQAPDLVDTAMLRSNGATAVKEVAGACFCCSFPTLVSRIGELAVEDRPDIILAEPVGSCTDLQATIVRPLADLYPEKCQVGPLLGLIDPVRARRILTNPDGAGLSRKSAYIWAKQIEECDVVALNKTDTLSVAEVEEIRSLIERHWPALRVFPISARTGEGLDALVAELVSTVAGKRVLDIDYDIYAQGEAELGWLNARMSFARPEDIDVDMLLNDLIREFGRALRQMQAEVAHLKMAGEADGRTAVANLVSSDSEPELSRPSAARVKRVDVTVNARIQTSPDVLLVVLNGIVNAVAARLGLTVERGETRSFRPGRPMPTHRLGQIA